MLVSLLGRLTRRTAHAVVATAATLALFACSAGGGGDVGPSDPPSDDIYGTWFLESVSGELLPGRINQFRDEQLEINVKEEIIAGFLILKQDQTFEFAFVTRATAGPDIPIPAEGALPGGKFRREGNLLRRIRSTGETGETGEALVLTGDGKLQWVLSFPQGAPGSAVDVPQTLTYSQSLPAE